MSKYYETVDTFAELLATESFGRENTLWICDERFLPLMQKHKLNHYAVSAGEDLKDLKFFTAHIHNILDQCPNISRDHFQIIAMGGGSVGDFAGFIASVLKRGLDLIHIPTTWLALIDSSHGGKTALNVGAFKNQIGTFYPAKKIYAVKEVLQEQNPRLLQEATSEILKVFLLKDRNAFFEFNFDRNTIWSFIEKAVQIKYQYIEADPYEKSGERTFLNLGHTWAHILELSQRQSHGAAVMQGLFFCLSWSLKKNYLNQDDFTNIHTKLESLGFRKNINPVSKPIAYQALQQDKKFSGDKNLRFIFLSSSENAKVESVKLDDIMNFAEEEGWLV